MMDYIIRGMTRAHGRQRKHARTVFDNADQLICYMFAMILAPPGEQGCHIVGTLCSFQYLPKGEIKKIHSFPCSILADGCDVIRIRR